MAISGNFYINGSSLASATRVFLDINLTITAPEGWYSDGLIGRKQNSFGFLLDVIDCPSCLLACNDTFDTFVKQGLYESYATTEGQQGALVIYFDTNTTTPADAIPVGIRVTVAGPTDVVYNKLTSPTYGALESNDAQNYTFIGDVAFDCGVGSTLDGGGYSSQDTYIYNVGGGGFPTLPDNQFGVVTGTSGDVQLTASNPGVCTMVIPFLSTDISSYLVSIFNPCGSNQIANIQMKCPAPLLGMSASDVGGDCSSFLPNFYYNVPNVSGTPGEPGLNEFFMLDENGANYVPAGVYKVNPVSGAKLITVDANGVITNISNCP